MFPKIPKIIEKDHHFIDYIPSKVDAAKTDNWAHKYMKCTICNVVIAIFKNGSLLVMGKEITSSEYDYKYFESANIIKEIMSCKEYIIKSIIE